MVGGGEGALLVGGEEFVQWLDGYRHGTLILNVKEEGLEDRLLDLISHFQANTESADTMYCRGGRQGGHTIPAPNFVIRQLT